MSYVTFDIDHETETITFGLPAIKGIASTKNNGLKSFEPEKDIDIYLDSDNWDDLDFDTLSKLDGFPESELHPTDFTEY